MRLKEIEISGFKSFAKKASMPFDARVTSVVGPNGSGKSNVVEAFRFVLGEQSMKSMRGKSGSDLIFRGGPTAPKMSRAAVSITFDNSDKVFALSAGTTDGRASMDTARHDPAGSPMLFDTITFTRELFSDGTSKYSMNGTEIRLKTMVELLASVNIGTSTHHIISQGEADGVLRASAKERREILEDALGLKVIHTRIKESVNKLTKADTTLKEVMSLRRELAPHLAFLKRQVEKLEKSRAIRSELETAQIQFLSNERIVLRDENTALTEAEDFAHRNKKTLQERLASMPDNTQQLDTGYVQGIQDIKQSLFETENKRRNIEQQIARLQGVIQAHRDFQKKAPIAHNAVSFAYDTYIEILARIEKILSAFDTVQNIEDAKKYIQELHNLHNELSQKTTQEKEVAAEDHSAEIHHIALDIEHFEIQLRDIVAAQADLLNKQKELEIQREKALLGARTQTEERYGILAQIQQIDAELQVLAIRKQSFIERKSFFDTELREAGFLFGPAFLHAVQNTTPTQENTSSVDMRKHIEKLKIRLDEHASIGSEVLTEYESAVERDTFLAKEVVDIETSMRNLELLIIDLKKTLDDTFVQGVNNINEKFGEFFKAMFGGGNAFLSIVHTKKRTAKKDDDIDTESEEENEENMERGIEVHVSLPEKKVKELVMLSGGERSLVSIALLFAISQVNPPPFLVLDETDAALDEANARRYGDMIERLSAYSQLIVVTHNRETMSRASVLYGVTLGADGGSKVLSIKFDEAVKVAK
ncbi:MAG: AAA family ATPase [bacterium]